MEMEMYAAYYSSCYSIGIQEPTSM